MDYNLVDTGRNRYGNLEKGVYLHPYRQKAMVGFRFHSSDEVELCYDEDYWNRFLIDCHDAEVEQAATGVYTSWNDPNDLNFRELLKITYEDVTFNVPSIAVSSLWEHYLNYLKYIKFNKDKDKEPNESQNNYPFITVVGMDGKTISMTEENYLTFLHTLQKVYDERESKLKEEREKKEKEAKEKSLLRRKEEERRERISRRIKTRLQLHGYDNAVLTYEDEDIKQFRCKKYMLGLHLPFLSRDYLVTIKYKDTETVANFAIIGVQPVKSSHT
ncbi:inner centromere protein A-like protein [Bacillus phage Shbh1]|uniref:Inner centromere protein A-like protein n=1 Tax=Bacillus phage Shbh1 TaxID=1796992 RepID=A0A142F154_9CAUD|nr:inner centromere protein A-like protein [Bacillus phage Shbh1]AMQ66511.1 inner centromere protein A-like protein [Bacillus phage Shbh1]